MGKLFVGLIAILVSISASAEVFSGVAQSNESNDCSAWKNHPFIIVMDMPDSQYKAPTIKDTVGFKFYRDLDIVNKQFNIEGVRGYCDYNMEDLPILINNKSTTLYRLTIASKQTQSGCQFTKVSLEIQINDGEYCEVPLT